MPEPLNYSSPDERSQKDRVIALLAAFFGVPIWMVGIPLFVSGLPRSMQGEAVIIPWWLCVTFYFAVPVLAIPRILRRRRDCIVAFAVTLLACVGAYYLLGFDDFLDKAWRRGL